MNIHLLSDLYLDFALALNCSVLCVMGNHEYYDQRGYAGMAEVEAFNPFLVVEI
ncbi:MAG: hypothetical protein PF483_06140 [Halothiobacillus sp.]|jgi:hypothetical protein|nr:hypothetical protein [Halothiobacillus sp.]